MTRDSPWRAVFIVFVALLVPVVPFVLFGEHSETWIRQNLLSDAVIAGSGQPFLIVVAVLASDILLPVPSSAVLTFAGARLGWLAGTIAGWLGLTISCLVGYWLGHRFGLPLVRRLSSPQHIQAARRRIDRQGPWMLLASRALPVIAEACVLVCGVYRMRFRSFIVAVAIANLALSATFCALGLLSASAGWFLPAMLVSIAVPCLLMLLFKGGWTDRPRTSR